MGCVDENQALRYVQGLLSAQEEEALQAHVAGCDECRHLLADAGDAVREEPESQAATRDIRVPAGTDSFPAPPQLPAVLLPFYELGPRLGAGGMGTVYAARHRRLPRRFAIKFLATGAATDAVSMHRMQREAQITSSLAHPNIVDVVDFNHTDDGTPLIVMELLEGESLSQRLRREGPLPLERALPIIEQVVSALSAAHAAGVVHRDLKPSNVFLCRRGDNTDFVKLVDFGLSKLVEQGAGAPGEPDASRDHGAGASGADPPEEITGVWSVLGSPGFMSPEQAVGRSSEVDARSDIFALGATVYSMLTGEMPFAGGDLDSMLANVVHGELGDTPRWRRLPQAVREVILRATDKDPQCRQQTVEQFWDAFTAACWSAMAVSRPATTSEPSREPGSTPPPRRSWVGKAALGAAILGAILLVGGLLLWRHQGQPQRSAPPQQDAAATARQAAPAPAPDGAMRPDAGATLPPDGAPVSTTGAANHGSAGHRRHRSPRRRRHARRRGTLVVQTRSAADGQHLWADVYLDGKKVGQSTLTLRGVSAGKHRLEVRRAGYRTAPRVVHVRPGARTRAVFELRRAAQ